MNDDDDDDNDDSNIKHLSFILTKTLLIFKHLYMDLSFF